MYHFIVNPIAKGGKLKKEWPRLEKLIESKVDAYKVHFTNYHGHATEIVSNLTIANEEIIIIAVGGDGTINEVINGIVNYDKTRLGYIPFGSGMDFARGNGIPMKAEEALNTIIRGKLKGIKISRVMADNGVERCFASSCGLGFDAEVSSAASIEKTSLKKLFNKLNLGTLIYVYLVLKHLLTFNRLSIEVDQDGHQRKYNNAWFITFSNNPYVGGGMMMNPKANPSEEILDATVAFELNRRQILALLPTIFKGTHIHHQGVELLKGNEYQVSSNRPIEVHVDGEVIGKCTTLSVQLQKEILSIFA